MRKAWEEEARGDWQAAVRTLRSIRGSRAESFTSAADLEDLLVRHGQWIAAAETLASARRTETWDTLRVFDLYVAAGRRDLATAWATRKGRTEADLVRRAILQSESREYRWMGENYRGRLAQIPLKPELARQALGKRARIAGLALDRKFLLDKQARIERAHARLISGTGPESR